MIKENSWTPYKRKAKSIEINIKDHFEQTIDFFKLDKGKDRDLKRIIKKIREEYGFDFSPKDKKGWIDKDLDW